MANYNGISFPFRVSGGGGVTTSELKPDEISRIMESITQIILTYPGERVMQPAFGCRVRDYIFENTDDLTVQSLIKYEIEKSLETWEDRIKVEEIMIAKEDGKINEGLLATITFFVYKYQTSGTVSVNLEGGGLA